jgi:hypothetical protein
MWYETAARSSRPNRARAREVPHRPGECLRGVEAGVDRAPRRLQTQPLRELAARPRALDATRQPPARREVDAHPEEARRGLSHDLRQPGGVGRVAASDRVGPARALEHHDRLDQVRVDRGARGRAVDDGRKLAVRAAAASTPPGLFA